MNPDKPTTDEWTTTADKDGDCAIVVGTTLIGVGATVQQTLNIVAAHNAALGAEREKWNRPEARTFNEYVHDNQQLRAQLAAAVEALKHVRAAYTTSIQDRNIIDTALAKIGGL